MVAGGRRRQGRFLAGGVVKAQLHPIPQLNCMAVGQNWVPKMKPWQLEPMTKIGGFLVV